MVDYTPVAPRLPCPLPVAVRFSAGCREGGRHKGRCPMFTTFSSLRSSRHATTPPEGKAVPETVLLLGATRRSLGALCSKWWRRGVPGRAP
eukprot:647292-Pelagomonas_calceolata.AAC.1